MRNATKSLIMTVLAVLMLASAVSAGIARVGRSFNVIGFSVGYADPIGEYDHIDVITFEDQNGRIVNLDADAVYDPTYSIGFHYGQLRENRLYVDFGFRYTKVKTLDTFWVDPGYGYTFSPETPDFNLYDIDLNLNFFLIDPMQSVVAPYLGLGFHGGLISSSGRYIDTQSDLVFGTGLNFGADIKFWQSPTNASYLTLSSVNEYQFLRSSDRPRYLTIGGAIKYYFRY